MSPAAYVFALLCLVAPPERRAAEPPIAPSWAETAEQVRARYQRDAEAIAAAVYDPGEAPAYQGPHGRDMTARLLVALASVESGLAPDVDAGRCLVDAWHPQRCGGGRYWSAWQLDGATVRQVEGVEPAALADVAVAARVALHFARRSVATCRRLGPDAALDLFVGGRCADRPDSPVRLAGLVRLRAAARLPLRAE
jgi:hypothetical protein